MYNWNNNNYSLSLPLLLLILSLWWWWWWWWWTWSIGIGIVQFSDTLTSLWEHHRNDSSNLHKTQTCSNICLCSTGQLTSERADMKMIGHIWQDRPRGEISQLSGASGPTGLTHAHCTSCVRVNAAKTFIGPRWKMFLADFDRPGLWEHDRATYGIIYGLWAYSTQIHGICFYMWVMLGSNVNK